MSEEQVLSLQLPEFTLPLWLSWAVTLKTHSLPRRLLFGLMGCLPEDSKCRSVILRP